MKSTSKIPVSKLSRTNKLLKTGAKVGVNYIKYFGNKIFDDEDTAQEKLHKDNADDIYDSLKELKGSALKMAQMMSMEQNILPKDYVDKFSLSQFSVPPLSGPLVVKTFKKYFKQPPNEFFDEFDINAINAASIGQVHLAEKNGKKIAVKIQYPGVADSILSDLALVKPIALRVLKLKEKESEKYFEEIKNKLLEETNYKLELYQSIEISKACQGLENIKFPDYYPEYSNEKILCMEYLQGKHIPEFIDSKPSQQNLNKIAQSLWDFYMFQIHHLKFVHADPHPGNFIITKDNKLGVIDFGCMKQIPTDFYKPYSDLISPDCLNDNNYRNKILYELEVLRDDDSPKNREIVSDVFRELLFVFAKPFYADTFDFSDPEFLKEINQISDKLSSDTELRKLNVNRGSEHFIYLNRTFFGLYNIMNQLNAKEINTSRFLN